MHTRSAIGIQKVIFNEIRYRVGKNIAIRQWEDSHLVLTYEPATQYLETGLWSHVEGIPIATRGVLFIL